MDHLPNSTRKLPEEEERRDSAKKEWMETRKSLYSNLLTDYEDGVPDVLIHQKEKQMKVQSGWFALLKMYIIFDRKFELLGKNKDEADKFYDGYLASIENNKKENWIYTKVVSELWLRSHKQEHKIILENAISDGTRLINNILKSNQNE